MAEELIYSIVFNGTDKSIDAIKSIDQEVARLTGEVNKLNAVKKENGALNDAETKALIDLKAQIKALNSDRAQQERQLININKSLNAETASYNELTTAVNAAKARLKELPIDQTSEQFRELQQFVAVGTARLKEFDKGIGDFQRNVGNYPTTFNLATASIKSITEEIARLKSVAEDLDINSEEFKDTTETVQELETAILRATGKIDEFGDKEPKNAQKKAYDDLADSAAGVVAGIQLVTLALGDEETAEKATEAATKATAIATNFQLLLKAKEAVVDTAAIAIKKIKIFLFGEELAATTSLTTQTVLLSLAQKANAAATSIATAAANAFGVSVATATAGISVLVGLLAAAVASLISFGAQGAESQNQIKNATKETNDELQNQKDIIDGYDFTKKEIEIGLKKPGLEKDLAELDLERQKALKKFEDDSNAALRAVDDEREALKKLFKETGEYSAEKLEENAALRRKLANEYYPKAEELEQGFQIKADAIRQEYADKEKKRLEDIAKKNEEEQKKREEALKKEKQEQDKLNAEFLKGAEAKQKEFDDERERVAKLAAEQQGFANQQIDEERRISELSKKLKIDEFDLTVEFYESGYKTFKEFEDKKLNDIEKANETRKKYDDEYTESVKKNEEDIAKAKEIAVQQISGILSEINNIQKQSANDQIAAIDAQAEREIENVNQSNLNEEEKAAKIKAIQQRAAKEKYDIEVKAFNANKAIQALQATIAGALAIVQALAQLGPISGAVAAVGIGITTALQVGAILAQKPPAPPAFAKGGYVSGAGSGTSDSIPAMLSNGESVINAKSTSAFAPLLSAINEWGGGRRFANGGIVAPSSFNQLAESNARGRSFDVINNRIDRIKVYQVESEMSLSQVRVGNIEAEATW